MPLIVAARVVSYRAMKKFKTKLFGEPGSEVAAFHPPFDPEREFGKKGRVPVRGTINGAPFRSSLCHMKGQWFMVVNKQLREAGKCKAGDTVNVVLDQDTEKRVMPVPPWLKKIINSNPKAKAFWEKSAYTHQKEYVNWILEAKQEETRQRRVEKMMDALRAGRRKQ